MNSLTQTDMNTSMKSQVQERLSAIQWHRHVRSHYNIQYSWKSNDHSDHDSLPRSQTETELELSWRWLHLDDGGPEVEDLSRRLEQPSIQLDNLSRRPRTVVQYDLLPFHESEVSGVPRTESCGQLVKPSKNSDLRVVHSARAFRAHAGDDSSTNSHGKSGPHVEAHGSLDRRCSRGQGREEHDGRQNDNEDEGDSDSDGDVPRLATKIAKFNDSKPPMFACPFHKRFHGKDLNEYRICSRGSWKTFHRVKEHVFRKHRLPQHQCPRCLVSFDTRECLATHLRELEPCDLLQDYKEPAGVTPGQLEALKRRKSGMSDEQRWIAMYKILFPDVPEDEIPTPWYERWQSPVEDAAAMIQSLRDSYQDVLRKPEYRLKLQTKIWKVVYRDVAMSSRHETTNRITTAILKFQRDEFDLFIQRWERSGIVTLPSASNMRDLEGEDDRESRAPLLENVAFSPTMFLARDHLGFLDLGPLPETSGDFSTETNFPANPSPQSLELYRPQQPRLFEYPIQENGPVWLGT
ncbi:hypothetical protein F5Y18DRAFT_358626 [Xylariaceae sp. FL1019]|nr:hypothetical protein F5Y18DRAFT_358626 [Xylariaceae sp. FL1019]